MAEWLWRVTQAKACLATLRCILMGFARVGSNPTLVNIIFFLLFICLDAKWRCRRVKGRAVFFFVAVASQTHLPLNLYKELDFIAD